MRTDVPTTPAAAEVPAHVPAGASPSDMPRAGAVAAIPVAVTVERGSPCCGGEPAVRVRDLCVRHRGAHSETLCGLSLDVHAGEHVAIVGASGSGKTTLLRSLAQRLAPQSGTVECSGRVATIHQDLGLVRSATAIDNVLHGALGRLGLRGAIAFPVAERARAAELLRAVGLGGKERRRAGRLSGGEQQRVAIARALMQEPCVLLADEPVAALDQRTARDVLGLLRGLCVSRGITLISVLHQPELAQQFADRIIRLERGRLHACAASEAAGQTCAVCVEHEAQAGGALGIGPAAALTPCAGGQQRPATIEVSGSASTRTGDGRAAVSSIAPPSADGVDPLRGRAWRFAGVALVAAGVYAWAFAGLRIDAAQLADAAGGTASFIRGLVPGSIGEVTRLPWGTLLASLAETIQMSIVGTTLGVLVAGPLAVAAARNLAPRWLGGPVRQLLNVIRTVPALVWALLCVAAVGFGPLAGVLALSAYATGYLTKFFYEALEGVDRRAQDALAEIGAGGLARFRHAVLPAALPMLASSCLFMLEYNVRAASVLGVVDAGGIGWHIKQYLDWRDFPAALACLGLILLVVIGLDAVSSRVRAWAVARSQSA